MGYFISQAEFNEEYYNRKYTPLLENTSKITMKIKF